MIVCLACSFSVDRSYQTGAESSSFSSFPISTSLCWLFHDCPIQRVAYLAMDLAFCASGKCIYLLFSPLVFRSGFQDQSSYLLACKFPPRVPSYRTHIRNKYNRPRLILESNARKHALPFEFPSYRNWQPKMPLFFVSSRYRSRNSPLELSWNCVYRVFGRWSERNEAIYGILRTCRGKWKYSARMVKRTLRRKY